jgi:hypothetical protein
MNWRDECFFTAMDRVSFWRGAVQAQGEESKTDLEKCGLRNQLMSLTVDWELAALTLDAQRYKTNTAFERESLRDSANTYRKCISELSEILSASSMRACKTE